MSSVKSARNGLYPLRLFVRRKIPPQARMIPAPVMTGRFPACFLRTNDAIVPVPAAATAATAPAPDMSMSRTRSRESSAEKTYAANKGRQAPAKTQPVMTNARDRVGIRSLCPVSGNFCGVIFSRDSFFNRMKAMSPLMTAVRNATAAPVISSRQSRMPSPENGCLPAIHSRMSDSGSPATEAVKSRQRLIFFFSGFDRILSCYP